MQLAKLTLGAILCAALPVASAAESQIASYYVELGPQDFYNSSGTRLTNGASIFQQDRANYHRFGIRHGGDSGDPVFGNREMRSQIGTLLSRTEDAALLQSIARMDPATAARTGYADWIVFICGTNGRMTKLVIDYADGDGYNGC